MHNCRICAAADLPNHDGTAAPNGGYAPVVLFNVGGFRDPLLAQLDLMARTGLLKPASRDLIRQARSADEALSVLTAAASAQPEKWITAKER